MTRRSGATDTRCADASGVDCAAVVFLLAALLGGCRDPCESTARIDFYLDADGDGFGVEQVVVASCRAPRGYASVAGDCDDSRADVHPSAVERCDILDRDCDGDAMAQAEDQEPFYLDADGDGDGDATSMVSSCTRPTFAHVKRGRDCDDADPDRSTRAVELPYTGIDEDCDASTYDDDRDGDGLPFASDCDDEDVDVGTPLPLLPHFTEVASSSGLIAVASDATCLPKCSSEVMAGGAAVADYDDDGDLDIVLVRIDMPSQLLENDGTGHFTDVSAARGFTADGPFGAAVFFDLGGDGDLDLYVAAVGAGSGLLFVQNDSGQFEEEAGSRGADAPVLDAMDKALHFSVSAGDADRDGDVDIHLPSWRLYQFLEAPHTQLLLDDGLGMFSRGDASLGLELTSAASFASSFIDVSGDGFSDFALAADFSTSRLFVSSAPGVFDDVTSSAGVGTDENGMGSTFGDYDSDGDLDWFVSSIYVPAERCGSNVQIGCTGNRLYRNRGDGVFDDVTSDAGVRNGGWGWRAAFFDFDLDGDLDLGHTNGFQMEGHRDDRIRLFVADGAGHFENRSCAHGLWAHGQGRAFIPFDMDRDGDLDILTTEYGAPPLLYRNDGVPQHAWLEVRLSDPSSHNTRALGAIVYARASAFGPRQRQDVHASSTFAGVGPAEAHFGFGAHVGPIAEVIVRWPDGTSDTYVNVATHQVLTIVRPP